MLSGYTVCSSIIFLLFIYFVESFIATRAMWHSVAQQKHACYMPGRPRSLDDTLVRNLPTLLRVCHANANAAFPCVTRNPHRNQGILRLVPTELEKQWLCYGGVVMARSTVLTWGLEYLWEPEPSMALLCVTCNVPDWYTALLKLLGRFFKSAVSGFAFPDRELYLAFSMIIKNPVWETLGVRHGHSNGQQSAGL